MSENIFRKEYRKLSEEEVKQVDDIKDAAFVLHQLIAGAATPDGVEGVIPKPGNGRHISLAKTALEESVMWAVKGITG